MAQSIAVENLAKLYRLGETHRDNMIRDVVMDLVRRPFRRRRKRQPRTIWALRDVSFAVNEGEVVGIIGRNGAGKSTLLKVLSRITYPTAGRISVRGRVASLLEVGTGFHEELTGRENVYLNGSILGMKKREIDAKLDAIIDFAGVGAFMDTPIKRYSSGMRLRLGFAVAAYLDPDVLFVDEVLAVGDAEFQKKCLRAMDDIRSGGRTVLFVSHNMSAVENLCPRTIWIEQGRIRLDGNTADVIRQYMSTFANVQRSGCDLTDFQARHGTGLIRFTSIEFRSPDGKPKDVIRSGDNLVLRFHYHANAPVKRPHFGIQVDSTLGTMLTGISTYNMGIDVAPAEPGDGYIDLEIDFLNLMPGRYYLSMSVATEGPVWHDYLEHCVALDVETSDFYGTGKGINPRFGLVFFPCRWKQPGGGGIPTETGMR